MSRRTLKTAWLLASVAVLLAAESCQKHSKGESMDTSRDIAAVEKAIHASIGWAKEKDFGLLYGTMANDPDLLIVNPEDKVVRGFDEFRKSEAFWGSPNFMAVRYEIRDLKISISRGGEAAWFYCVLDDINEWKGKPANWENTRWTGVLEKRQGKWVIVQMHFSFAAK